MGLDLYLYKIKREEDLTKEDKEKENYFVIRREEDEEDNITYNEVKKSGIPIYKRVNEYYDFTNIPLLDGRENEFVESGLCYSGYESYVSFKRKGDGPFEPGIKIDLSDVGRKDFEEDVIYYEYKEIAYQRKQMNSNFYKEWCHEGAPWIVTKKIDMERISSQSNIPEYTKKEFLDNFIEGETILFISY